MSGQGGTDSTVVRQRRCQACGVVLTGGTETYGQISPSMAKETLYWCNAHRPQQDMYFENMRLQERVRQLEQAVHALAKIATSRGWTADLSSSEDVWALLRAQETKT